MQDKTIQNLKILTKFIWIFYGSFKWKQNTQTPKLNVNNVYIM